MRYLMNLGAALAVILLLSAALACGGDGGADDDGRGDDAPIADDLSPDDPQFQATIDAALARIAATRADTLPVIPTFHRHPNTLCRHTDISPVIPAQAGI